MKYDAENLEKLLESFLLDGKIKLVSDLLIID